MKKYINPEMKMLAFVAEEAISAGLEGNLQGSNLYNDTSFGGLLGSDSGEPLNG